MTEKIVSHISAHLGITNRISLPCRRILVIFVLPVLLIYLVWSLYMTLTGNWEILYDYFYMTLTMIAGSFVAGASSEGGGAIAFPVMTLVFNIPPGVARTFSLAIQSIGMTAATLWIIARKIPVEKTYLLLGIAGGTAGIIFSTYFVAPYVAPAYTKMLFVSFWLSFGLALFAINHVRQRDTHNKLPVLTGRQQTELVLIGFIGGTLSGILGSGIDICTFAFVTMKYHLSEKVATPTSVVLMASNAVAGFLLHLVFIGDVTPEIFNYWLASIPVVVLGAPMGALVVNKLQRLHIAGFLYSIILIQFVSAILIIQPGGKLLAFSVATFLAGLVIFFLLTRQGRKLGVLHK